MKLVCPRCRNDLNRHSENRWECSSCLLQFPVREGIPYIIFRGRNWRPKLRELIRYADFYGKIKSRALERDRLLGKEDQASITFAHLNSQFFETAKLIDFSKRPLICDVGAGCGEVSQKLAEMGAQVTACDINMFDLHHDVRLMTFVEKGPFFFYDALNGERVANPAFERVIADGDYLPFPDESFDYVVMRATAHHVLDLKFFFRELNRLLKAGGMLIMMGEPLASVLDNREEYWRDDIDWQEGITENRPAFRDYSRALKLAGFSEINVQCFYSGFGFRIPRLLSRMNLTVHMPKFLQRPVSGWKTIFLNFMGSGMNLWARKQRHQPNLIESSDDRDSLGDLLANMPQDVPAVRRIYRESLKSSEVPNRYDFAHQVDRNYTYGFRDPEIIDGRIGRYLLSIFSCLLARPAQGPVIAIRYNLCQFAGQRDQPVQLFINDVRQEVEWQFDGWRTLTVPLIDVRHPVVELRILQPKLIERTHQFDEKRDVGLALATIDFESGLPPMPAVDSNSNA